MTEAKAKFRKKEEPFCTESKDTVSHDIYKSLISKISTKVTQGNSNPKQRPPTEKNQDNRTPSAFSIGQGGGLVARVAHSQNSPLRSKEPLNRLQEMNRSLISRLSNQRGTKGGDVIRGQDQGILGALAPGNLRAREGDHRNNLKERINKLSTLERTNNELEESKIGGKKHPAPVPLGNTLALLQKYKITQLRNGHLSGTDFDKYEIGSNPLKGLASLGLHSGGITLSQHENTGTKIKQSIDLLKRKLGRTSNNVFGQGTSRKQTLDYSNSKETTQPLNEAENAVISCSLNSLAQQSHPQPFSPIEPQSCQEVKVMTTVPIDINLYKKKVQIGQYKREDQSSVKILKSRASVEPTRKNITMTGGEQRVNSRRSRAT